MDIEKRINDVEQLPLFLNVKDISNVMDICKAKAYELFNNENFPSIKLGKRMLVSRHAFVLWMENPNGGIKQ